jgi:hypothetical protein
MGEQGDKQFIGWICGLPTDKTKAVAIADVLLFRQPFRKLCSEASPTPKAFGRNNKKSLGLFLSLYHKRLKLLAGSSLKVRFLVDFAV